MRCPTCHRHVTFIGWLISWWYAGGSWCRVHEGDEIARGKLH
jgi:hypothetical protein